MTATTATDPSGVQYFFHNLTIAGHDSGWLSGATYVDTGLSPNTTYTYQVRTRDQSTDQNPGTYSAWRRRDAAGSRTRRRRLRTRARGPPLPYAAGTTSISMTATTASDPSGVLYFFHNLTITGHDSGWQASATYVDTGLSPNTTYTYQVMTRDQSSNQNPGSYSIPASATTQMNQRPFVPSVTTPTSPQIGNVTVSYILTDAESDTCSIQVQYSLNGGATWNPATAVLGQGDGTTSLASSPTGVSHTFVWASGSDIVNVKSPTYRFASRPATRLREHRATPMPLQSTTTSTKRRRWRRRRRRRLLPSRPLRPSFRSSGRTMAAKRT